MTPLPFALPALEAGSVSPGVLLGGSVSIGLSKPVMLFDFGYLSCSI